MGVQAKCDSCRVCYTAEVAQILGAMTIDLTTPDLIGA